MSNPSTDGVPENPTPAEVQALTAQAISKPLVTHIYTADPSAHVFDGAIYIYPSHDVEGGVPFNDNGDHFCMEDYHVFRMASPDSEAVDCGVALHVKDVPWAERQMWAPDAARKNGKYYLYFPAKRPDGIFQIGVAVGDRPEGPFKPEPQAIEGSYSIDPAVFGDEPEVDRSEGCDDAAGDAGLLGDLANGRDLERLACFDMTFRQRPDEPAAAVVPRDQCRAAATVTGVDDEPSGRSLLDAAEAGHRSTSNGHGSIVMAVLARGGRPRATSAGRFGDDGGYWRGVCSGDACSASAASFDRRGRGCRVEIDSDRTPPGGAPPLGRHDRPGEDEQVERAQG